MISYIFRIRNKILSYTVKFKTYIYGLEFKKFGKNNRIWFPIAVYGKRNVSIGDNCGINTYIHIWGNGGVTIGNNVMIATHVSITSLTHDYNAPSMRFSPVLEMPVVIEDDVWIGSNAVIMPGITVGKGSVVGAGAIVTRNVPPNSIVAGAPAKVVKWRNCATDEDKKMHEMLAKDQQKVATQM